MVQYRIKQKIDEGFLEKNTRIRNALYSNGIKTYDALFNKAKQERYNLYYIRNLGIDSIKRINEHVKEKFRKKLPNYEKNLHD